MKQDLTQFESQSADASGGEYHIPGFTRASENTGDPVGRRGDDWGFWDECWCDWHGGYADEAAARSGLANYVANVLEGVSAEHLRDIEGE